jgi:O-antigen/teichoic acid export membrane protein
LTRCFRTRFKTLSKFSGYFCDFCAVRREFLLNLILLVLINVLVKPVFIFGVDLSVQNRSVAGEYGLYFALLNWAYLFQIISDVGLQNFNTRQISQHRWLLPKYFYKLLLIKIGLSLLYGVVALLLAALSGYPLSALGLLALLLFNQATVQMTLFLRSNISGLGQYRTDSWLSALDKLLMLILCGALLWQTGAGAQVSIFYFVGAQTLALLITLVVVVLILYRVSGGQWQKGRLTWAQVGYFLRSSWPFALVILLMSAYTRTDTILLERLLPDGNLHADIFAGAYRLIDALNMIGYLFASLLLPMFSLMLSQRKPVLPLTSLAAQLMWAGSFTGCCAIFFTRTDLVALMFADKPDWAYRSDTLGILIWSFAAVGQTYVFSTLLTADRQLMRMNRFFVVGIVLDIALNLVLVPDYQAIGSAWSALCTQIFIALAMIFTAWRTYQFPIQMSAIFRLVLFTSLVGAGAVGAANWGVGWWWQAGCILALGTVATAIWLGPALWRQIRQD